MKIILPLLLFSLALCARSEEFNIPKLKAPDIIDAELAEGSWKKALLLKDFTKLDSSKPQEKTEVRFFRDENNLYVGFKAYFKDYASKERELAKRLRMFTVDVVEIFVDPGSSGHYSHIAMDISGELYLSDCDKTVRGAIKLYKDYYIAEFAIPFSALKLGSGEFKKEWKLNFARGNHGNKEFSTWSRLSNSFHEQENFNKVYGFDDVDLYALRRIRKEHDAKQYVLTLPERLFTGMSPIDFTLELNKIASLKNYSLTVKLFDNKNVLVSKKTFNKLFFTNEISFPVGNWKNGKHYLQITLQDSKKKNIFQDTISIWKIPPKTSVQKDVFTIKNHIMYRNGKLFFPIMIDGWTFNAFRDEHKNLGANGYYAIQDEYSRDIKEHGFNTVWGKSADWVDDDLKVLKKVGQIYPWEEVSVKLQKKWGVTFEEKMRRLRSYGLYYMVARHYIWWKTNDINIETMIKKTLSLRDMENIIGYFTADETDTAVEDNILRGKIFKKLDPSRPTYINVIMAVEKNKDAADIISTDPYPIPNNPITMVSSHMNRLEKVTKEHSSQSHFIVLQNFGDEGFWTRPPNPAELEAMTVLALNHGAKGLGYFLYVPQWRRKIGKRQNPATWEHLKKVNERTTRLAPVYCLGKRLFLGRRGNLDVAIIDYKDSVWVSAVNLKNNEIKNVKIQLNGMSGTGNVDGENRKVVLENGILTDNFLPYGVNIYRFKK